MRVWQVAFTTPPLPPPGPAQRDAGRNAPRTVEPNTQRRLDLGHVPHQIIFELAVFHRQNVHATSCQSSPHILKAKAAQTLPMLDHDRLHRVVSHQPGADGGDCQSKMGRNPGLIC